MSKTDELKMNWFEIIISIIPILIFICITIIIFRLFFFPPKDVLSQAFAKIFSQEQKDYINANYKQVIVGEKTLDELTKEVMEIELNEKYT